MRRVGVTQVLPGRRVVLDDRRDLAVEGYVEHHVGQRLGQHSRHARVRDVRGQLFQHRVLEGIQLALRQRTVEQQLGGHQPGIVELNHPSQRAAVAPGDQWRNVLVAVLPQHHCHPVESVDLGAQELPGRLVVLRAVCRDAQPVVQVLVGVVADRVDAHRLEDRHRPALHVGGAHQVPPRREVVGQGAGQLGDGQVEHLLELPDRHQRAVAGRERPSGLPVAECRHRDRRARLGQSADELLQRQASALDRKGERVGEPGVGEICRSGGLHWVIVSRARAEWHHLTTMRLVRSTKSGRVTSRHSPPAPRISCT